ncbi:MAG: PIG-L family deacetylase [Deltaproteobacteria bacterium]|nr:PIG-L family deacetylase [Deltaproteobacteria bacterium]
MPGRGRGRARHGEAETPAQASRGLLAARSVLVLGAHPDDETLGAGGVIARLASAGCRAHVVLFTRGDEGFARRAARRTVTAVRAREAARACEALGVATLEFFEEEDLGVRVDKAAIRRVIGLIRCHRPEVILAHHLGDRHPDHRAVGEVGRIAWWLAGGATALDLGAPWRAGGFYHFEILDPFTPTVIVDVTPVFDRVRKALERYTSQHAVVPRMIQRAEGMAMVRGAEIGVLYGQGLLQSPFMPIPLL